MTHAQNRIAYLVYSNPGPVRRLIDQRGFVPPGNVHHLVEATRQLVRRQGRSFTQELVRLHPDRKAILQVAQSGEKPPCPVCGRPSNASNTAEDHFCGACGHDQYSGVAREKDWLKELTNLDLDELEERYAAAVKRSDRSPEDKRLAEEVRLTWNALRKRKNEKQQEAEDKVEVPEIPEIRVTPKEAALVLAVTLVAGGLIGSAWGIKKTTP